MAIILNLCFNNKTSLPALSASNGVLLLKHKFNIVDITQYLTLSYCILYRLIRGVVRNQAVNVCSESVRFLSVSKMRIRSLLYGRERHAFRRHLCPLLVWRQMCTFGQSKPKRAWFNTAAIITILTAIRTLTLPCSPVGGISFE